MNCLVCQTPCSGQHYKTSSCRACAGFFRRTVQMKLRYRCKNAGNCQMTKETRFSCRFCRMQKCIAVGMVIDDESAGSPSFHLDTSVSVSLPTIDAQLPNLEEWDWFTADAIFNNSEHFLKFLKSRCSQILRKIYIPPSLPYKPNLCHQSALAYACHNKKWPEVRPETSRDLTMDQMEQFLIGYCKEMVHIADFLMEIEPFTRLPFKEKALIYPRYGMTFFFINRVEVSVKHLGNDPDCSKSITHDGHVFDYKHTKFDISSISNVPADQFKNLIMSSEEQFDNLFVKNFKKVLPDDFEVQYLLMRSLWSLHGIEGISKETLAIADEVLSRLDDEIAYYYKYEKRLTNVASRIYKLHNLLTALERVSESRMEDQRMFKMFEIFKLNVFLDDLGV